MSSGYGDNSKPKATSDEYRNSPYWDNLEAEKKRKQKAIEVREHHQEEAKIGNI